MIFVANCCNGPPRMRRMYTAESSPSNATDFLGASICTLDRGWNAFTSARVVLNEALILPKSS